MLVARDKTRLDERASELRAEFGVAVEVLAADLVDRAALAVVEARLAASRADRVSVLVNNAGSGLLKPFNENPVDDEQDLLDLLVTAPMRLAHAALSQMLSSSSGTVVNISSVAGLTPRSTYGALKAWILSFSRWANLSYRRRGIIVTAVAPGFVHTEFHDRMNVSKDGVPSFLWLDARTLVRRALRDVARGRAVSIPTLRYKIVVALAGLLPQRIVATGALRGR